MKENPNLKFSNWGDIHAAIKERQNLIFCKPLALPLSSETSVSSLKRKKNISENTEEETERFKRKKKL